jgi:hypothetical protein
VADGRCHRLNPYAYRAEILVSIMPAPRGSLGG